MSALTDLVDQAADSLAQAADKQKVFTDAAMAYLGVTSKTAPEVKKLAGEMARLEKEQPGTTQGFIAVQKAAASFTAAAAVTAAGVSKFAQAASPQLVGALGTSLELLSAKIGGQLLPVVGYAIDTVQDLADWFDTLTDGEKKLLAGIVVATPAIAFLGYGVKALVPAVNVATAAISRMAAASRSMGAGPLLGAAAGAAVIVPLVYEATKMLATSKPAEAGFYDHSARAGTAARVTEDEFKEGKTKNKRENELFQQYLTLPDPERKKLAAERAAHARKMAAEADSKWWVPDSVGEHLRERAEMHERAGEYGVSSKAETDWRKNVRNLSMQTSAANRENQPHYSGFAEARKQLQTQMLNKNPYEQKLLAEQRKNRTDMNKRLDELLAIGRKFGYRGSD